jgi:hypothetical protein
MPVYLGVDESEVPHEELSKSYRFKNKELQKISDTYSEHGGMSGFYKSQVGGTRSGEYQAEFTSRWGEKHQDSRALISGMKLSSEIFDPSTGGVTNEWRNVDLGHNENDPGRFLARNISEVISMHPALAVELGFTQGKGGKPNRLLPRTKEEAESVLSEFEEIYNKPGAMEALGIDLDSRTSASISANQFFAGPKQGYEGRSGWMHDPYEKKMSQGLTTEDNIINELTKPDEYRISDEPLKAGE